MWLIIEWLGTLIALSGSAVMASKKLSPLLGWKLWAFSHIFHIALFALHTHQYGLLAVQIVGISIALMGLWQWNHKKEINIVLMSSFSIMSCIGIVIAIGLSIKWMIEPSMKQLEWMGALFSISAALLLASKHKLLRFSWPLWIISNTILCIFTVSTSQWGVATLQLGFGLINLYGCYVWFIKAK